MPSICQHDGTRMLRQPASSTSILASPCAAGPSCWMLGGTASGEEKSLNVHSPERQRRGSEARRADRSERYERRGEWAGSRLILSIAGERVEGEKVRERVRGGAGILHARTV